MEWDTARADRFFCKNFGAGVPKIVAKKNRGCSYTLAIPMQCHNFAAELKFTALKSKLWIKEKIRWLSAFLMESVIDLWLVQG